MPQERDLLTDLLSIFDGPISPWVMDAAREIDPRHRIEPVDAASALAPLLWLLETIGTSGVAMTSAGYLPTDIVTQARETGYFEVFGTSTREADVRDLHSLRKTARQLRLLSMSRGRLRVTKRGADLLADPERLWWFVCDRLPLEGGGFGRACSILAMLEGLFSASGHRGIPDDSWHTRIDSALDLRWRSPDGHPPTYTFTETMHLLEIFGVLDRDRPWDRDFNRPQPGDAATIAFLRSALTQPGLPLPQTPAEEGPCLDLRVTLQHVEPAVWRTIRVPSRITLGDLHYAIQGAMGWTSTHLHQFVTAGGTPYSAPWPDSEVEDGTHIELWRVLQPGQTLRYDYDFGDGWEHTVEIVGSDTHPLAPVCLDGGRACPPEDIGGPPGYAEFLAAGPSAQFDATGFDPAWATERMGHLLNGPDERRLQVALNPG